MRCETVEELLARYAGNEMDPLLRARVADHLAECAECREALDFHRSLARRLDATLPPPSRLFGRVAAQAIASQPTFLTRILGDPTMKKILISSTAATALVASLLVLTPRAANASTPVEKFKKMRAALAKAMQSGELRIDLTATKDGVVEATCTLDGKPLPKDFPLYVQTSKEGNVMTVDVTAELDPESYSAIRYGNTQNTLEMVPKADPNQKSEVVLDPKTMKPTSWRTLVSKNGLWGPASASDLAKARSVRSSRPDSTIHAKIKMLLGQDATIRVGGG